MAKLLKVTMADVGKALGLSQTAVSLALRKDPSIPESTRRKVRQTAKRLGYRPHAGLSALMAQIRSQRAHPVRAELAAITSWGMRRETDNLPTLHLQWEGAKRRAKELGYSLEEFWLDHDGLTPMRLGSILAARNIEGAIVFPFEEKRRLDLPWEKLSAIAVGYTLEEPILHRVVTAHFDSVLIALEQLRARGYHRIGLVLDEKMNQRVRRSWLAAFCAFGAESGEVVLEAIVTLPGSAAEKPLAKWLKKYRPDAVICGAPYPIRAWLEELGYSAPRDLGVVRLAEYPTDDGCARVDEGWRQIGAAAVDLVVGQIHRGEKGLPRSPTLTLVRGEWVEGGAVRPAPVS